MASLFTASEVFRNQEIPLWGRDMFNHFYEDLMSEERPFPCILGVQGFKQNELRFGFIEKSDAAIVTLAELLTHYLCKYKSFGRQTSFVAFFQPDDMKTVEEYEQDFWSILRQLHELDECDWPMGIPPEPEDIEFEFSFHGEPIFVVCNTPAHSKRKSRYFETFMMTFQPRWVFEGMSGHTKKGQQIQNIVRKRIELYDEVAAHPSLGWYGDEDKREWKQYFLRDENETSLAKCPFHTKSSVQ